MLIEKILDDESIDFKKISINYIVSVSKEINQEDLENIVLTSKFHFNYYMIYYKIINLRYFKNCSR